MTVKILHNQSILDLAIQHTGSVENAFSIAIANGICVSDDLNAGSELEVLGKVNIDIQNYFSAKQIRPATAITTAVIDNEPQLGGIGHMQIGRNFKVS